MEDSTTSLVGIEYCDCNTNIYCKVYHDKVLCDIGKKLYEESYKTGLKVESRTTFIAVWSFYFLIYCIITLIFKANNVDHCFLVSLFVLTGCWFLTIPFCADLFKEIGKTISKEYLKFQLNKKFNREIQITTLNKQLDAAQESSIEQNKLEAKIFNTKLNSKYEIYIL